MLLNVFPPTLDMMMLMMSTFQIVFSVNSGEPTKEHLESSNNMSIGTSLHPIEIEGEKSAAPAALLFSDTPFPTGGLSDYNFVLDPRFPGVLCFKCIPR